MESILSLSSQHLTGWKSLSLLCWWAGEKRPRDKGPAGTHTLHTPIFLCANRDTWVKQGYYHTIMGSFEGGRSLEIIRRSGASLFDALRQRLVRNWGAYDSAWWWSPLPYNCLHPQQKLDWKKHNSVWAAAYTICFFWDSEFESNESRDRSLILEVAPSHLKLDFPLIKFWSPVALWSCVSFCGTAKWLSCMFTIYSPPLFLDFLPI